MLEDEANRRVYYFKIGWLSYTPDMNRKYVLEIKCIKEFFFLKIILSGDGEI